MRERFRHDIALGASLNSVIAERTGSLHAFLDIGRIEDMSGFLGQMSLDTCETIGLQFQSYRQLVCLRGTQLSAAIMRLLADT
jgi:hypothetical protein